MIHVVHFPQKFLQKAGQKSETIIGGILMLNRHGWSKRGLLGFLAFMGMILSFQNCGQNLSTISKESSSVSAPVSGTKSENSTDKSKSVYEKVDVLEIPESPTLDEGISAAMSNKADNLFASKKVLLDPKSGQIQVVDLQDKNIPDGQFCLKEDDLSELQAILTSSEICEASGSIPSHAVCAQIFTYPYAKVHMGQEVLSLGESYSSCQKGPDLCGEYSGLLKNFLSYVVTNLKNMKCDFTAL